MFKAYKFVKYFTNKSVYCHLMIILIDVEKHLSKFNDNQNKLVLSQ